MLKRPTCPHGDWFQATSGTPEATTIKRLPICNLRPIAGPFIRRIRWSTIGIPDPEGRRITAGPHGRLQATSLDPQNWRQRSLDNRKEAALVRKIFGNNCSQSAVTHIGELPSEQWVI